MRRQHINARADDERVSRQQRPTHRLAFEHFVNDAEDADAYIKKVTKRPTRKFDQNASSEKAIT